MEKSSLSKAEVQPWWESLGQEVGDYFTTAQNTISAVGQQVGKAAEPVGGFEGLAYMLGTLAQSLDPDTSAGRFGGAIASMSHDTLASRYQNRVEAALARDPNADISTIPSPGLSAQEKAAIASAAQQRAIAGEQLRLEKSADTRAERMSKFLLGEGDDKGYYRRMEELAEEKNRKLEQIKDATDEFNKWHKKAIIGLQEDTLELRSEESKARIAVTMYEGIQGAIEAGRAAADDMFEKLSSSWSDEQRSDPKFVGAQYGKLLRDNIRWQTQFFANSVKTAFEPEQLDFMMEAIEGYAPLKGAKGDVTGEEHKWKGVIPYISGGLDLAFGQAPQNMAFSTFAILEGEHKARDTMAKMGFIVNDLGKWEYVGEEKALEYRKGGRATATGSPVPKDGDTKFYNGAWYRWDDEAKMYVKIKKAELEAGE